MRKLLLISVILSLNICGAFSQINLVPNSSFEEYDTCPNYHSQINRAIGWGSYRNTPDYFHSCSSSIYVTVPNNAWGFQYPTSIACNAYCGLYTYGLTGANWREFIGYQLLSQINIGQKYYVSFKVSLGEKQSIATNNLGVLFSTVAFDMANPAPIINYAHVNQTNIIIDTTNWTIISGSYTPDSSYQYIIIGNFFNDSNTNIIVFDSSGTSGSYYFIDDICVSPDSIICNPFNFVCNVGIHENNIKNIISIFPNPFSDKTTLEVNSIDSYENLLINISDVFGRSLRSIKTTKRKVEISRENLPNGIYFINISLNQNEYKQKIIITN
ncbi:MAG: T9SS type A sorting domain-containing protein [Bacteroidales bacterium]